MVRIRSLCAWSVIAAALAALVSCGGGSGEGLDSNGRPLQPGGGETGVLAPNLQAIQAHVFTPACTACHAGATAPQGLRLDAGNSYAMLVNVASAQSPSLRRVAPGQPNDSYLIQKLEGHAAVGARMPLGGPYLDANSVAVIRQWIANGAPQ